MAGCGVRCVGRSVRLFCSRVRGVWHLHRWAGWKFFRMVWTDFVNPLSALSFSFSLFYSPCSCTNLSEGRRPTFVLLFFFSASDPSQIALARFLLRHTRPLFPVRRLRRSHALFVRSARLLALVTFSWHSHTLSSVWLRRRFIPPLAAVDQVACSYNKAFVSALANPSVVCPREPIQRDVRVHRRPVRRNLARSSQVSRHLQATRRPTEVAGTCTATVDNRRSQR